MEGSGGLRERKKQRTRQALVNGAAELFERKGYGATTVAEIAATADISTRSFFSYFKSKEAVLFVDADNRLQVALDVIAARGSADRPVDVLIRAVEQAISSDFEQFSRLGQVRIKLIRETPELLGPTMSRVTAAARQMSEALHAAFPDETDGLLMTTIVGALIGALLAAATKLLTETEPVAGTDQARPNMAASEHMQAEIHRAVWASFHALAAGTPPLDYLRRSGRLSGKRPERSGNYVGVARKP